MGEQAGAFIEAIRSFVDGDILGRPQGPKRNVDELLAEVCRVCVCMRGCGDGGHASSGGRGSSGG